MARRCSEWCGDTDCIQLTEREALVCDFVCSHEVVSFSVLRRATDLHQEVLSRIIKRLVRYGQIRKVGSGYSCNVVNN
jgi:DNA-binding MarR family transcriptional regulator